MRAEAALAAQAPESYLSLDDGAVSSLRELCGLKVRDTGFGPVKIGFCLIRIRVVSN